MTATNNGTRIISMSETPPVKIVEDDWPTLAFDYDKSEKNTIAIRKHKGGKGFLVYGVNPELNLRAGYHASSLQEALSLLTLVCEETEIDDRQRTALLVRLPPQTL